LCVDCQCYETKIYSTLKHHASQVSSRSAQGVRALRKPIVICLSSLLVLSSSYLYLGCVGPSISSCCHYPRPSWTFLSSQSPGRLSTLGPSRFLPFCSAPLRASLHFILFVACTPLQNQNDAHYLSLSLNHAGRILDTQGSNQHKPSIRLKSLST